MDICGGDGWEPLCTFLGRNIPDGEFPYNNRRSQPSSDSTKASARAGAAKSVTGKMKRLDKKPIQVSRDEILGFSRLKDENLRLPWWLEYQRRLGVTRFFILDNASTDGTTEYLLAQEDVHLFWSEESYAETRHGMVWIDALLNEFGSGHWCLITDTDELLFYPKIETVSLKRLTAYLDSKAYEVLRCGLIDMYSALPLGQVEYKRGQPFLEACPYFDSELDFQKRLGPRKRVFWEEGQNIKPPAQLKSPLVKWRKGLDHPDSHRIDSVKKADIRGALLHFKFFEDFEGKVNTAVESGQYSNGSAEYKIYKNEINIQKDINLFYDKSERFIKSDQLIKPNVMITSNSFDNLSKSKYRKLASSIGDAYCRIFRNIKLM